MSYLHGYGDCEFDDLSLDADECPYDTESELKVAWKRDPSVIDISPADQDMTKADSDLESMPGDDIESLFWFEAEEFDHDDDIHFMHKEELSKDDEKAADNVIDELVDMAKSQNDDVNVRSAVDLIREIKKMALEEAKAQMKEIKRLELLKAEKVKDEKRADPLPITKISYRIDNSTKQASMRITRNNQPLNHTVYDKFVLKMLGLSEWLEVHALASKRNLTLPEGVVGKEGMVIKELEAKIFLYNGNFDLVFQRRRSEYALASTPQLIRIQNLIKTESKLVLGLAECKASAGMKTTELQSINGAIKGLADARPQQAPHTYLSQRHRQGSQRLLEDILVSWDGYQLAGQVNKALWQDKVVFDLKHELKYELVKVVNTWQNVTKVIGLR
ncbi:hypothetical protein Tco_1329374 [Tanacetum coccineum]